MLDSMFGSAAHLGHSCGRSPSGKPTDLLKISIVGAADFFVVVVGQCRWVLCRPTFPVAAVLSPLFFLDGVCLVARPLVDHAKSLKEEKSLDPFFAAPYKRPR